jgi:two-component system, sensor histidine kinase PdtaS
MISFFIRKYILFFLLYFFFLYGDTTAQNDTSVIHSFQEKIKNFDKSGQTDSVLIYSQKVLQLSEAANYKKGIARSAGTIGRMYMDRGDYPQSLHHLFKSLGIYESLNDQSGMLIQLGNIGVVYNNQGDNSKALDYYFKALKIAQALKDKEHASIQYCNIAIIYSTQFIFPKAKEYFLKALEMDKELNNTEGIARNLNNLGNIYSDQNFHKEAIDYYLKALATSKELNDDRLKINFLVNLGNEYANTQQYKKAEDYLSQSAKLLDKIDDLDFKKQFEKILSSFYEGIENDKLALVHYKKYIELKDSIYNEDNTKKIVKAEMNYEFDKKQAATKFENDKIIYKLEAENKLQKQLRLFLVIFIFLALGLLFLAKRAYDNKKRIAEFMGSENDRKEILLQEVHHRINNNLQIISSLLSLQANNSEDEKLQGYLKQSQNRIQSLSVMHELLYQNDSHLQINMKEYLNKVMDYHKDVIENLPIRADVILDIADIGFPTKIAVPLALIVNELVTNSIKYAFNDQENGKICITLLPDKNEKDKWWLKVSDTGKGLPVETKMRKDSLGLRLVSIMTKQINGVLHKSNQEGAAFEIEFFVSSKRDTKD